MTGRVFPATRMMMAQAVVERLSSDDRPRVVVVGERFAELDRALSEHYTACERPPRPALVTGHDPVRPTVYVAASAHP